MFGSLESDVTSFHGPLCLWIRWILGYTNQDSHDLQDFELRRKEILELALAVGKWSMKTRKQVDGAEMELELVHIEAEIIVVMVKRN